MADRCEDFDLTIVDLQLLFELALSFTPVSQIFHLAYLDTVVDISCCCRLFCTSDLGLRLQSPEINDFASKLATCVLLNGHVDSTESTGSKKSIGQDVARVERLEGGISIDRDGL